jgi:hypothetical protein
LFVLIEFETSAEDVAQDFLSFELFFELVLDFGPFFSSELLRLAAIYRVVMVLGLRM